MNRRPIAEGPFSTSSAHLRLLPPTSDPGSQKEREVHDISNSVCSTKRSLTHVHLIASSPVSRSITRKRIQHPNQTALKIIALLLLVTLSIISTYANAGAHVVEIVTRIDPGDPVPGMKSRHKVSVDFQERKLKRIYVKTGTTYGIPSTRNKFSESLIGWDACGRGGVPSNCAKIQLKGQTASGVKIIPNIDYNFSVYVTHDGLAAIRGCHDGYPTYIVTVNGRPLYHFKHKSIHVMNLFGECDIKASGHIGDWEGS